MGRERRRSPKLVVRIAPRLDENAQPSAPAGRRRRADEVLDLDVEIPVGVLENDPAPDGADVHRAVVLECAALHIRHIE